MTLLGFTSNQLAKEESERMEKIENGEIVRGKGTILIWENMYVIGHYSDGERLSIETKDVNEAILKKLSSIKRKKKNCIFFPRKDMLCLTKIINAEYL